MNDELIITADNFNDYFFDVRKNKPKSGQIMARFVAVAAFSDGPEKRHVIQVLKTDKAKQAAMVMKKIHCAREPDCYRVCREMCQDLFSGMSDDEVAAKEYEFVLEAFYYTQRECVPKNDPHWQTIQMMKYDKDAKTYKSDIEI